MAASVDRVLIRDSDLGTSDPGASAFPVNPDDSGDRPAQERAQPHSPAGSLHSFFIDGPAGRLEALLTHGAANAQFATVICHPHPLGGGTMHNKVVYHAAKVFSAMGWPVLRFNFRATGLSAGVHDGRAEVGDVRAALSWLAREYALPIVAAGFSFGAAMGLEAASDWPGIQGFAALGLPAHAEGRDYAYPFLAACTFPKLFLSGDRDRYAPAAQLSSLLAAAPQSELIFIPGADHFFVGQLAPMQAALQRWLTDHFLHSFVQSPEATPAAETASAQENRG